jgi:hypothetical protein
MPLLLELQRHFAAAIFREADDLAAHVCDSGIAPADRIGIYRHTAFSALTGALKLTFPAVERLVGGEFFEHAAEAFIRAHPPLSGYPGEYGGAFSDFLATFAPAASLAYLPDVADFEWALNVAATAPDAAPVDPAALALVDPSDHGRLRFVPHPSLTLMRSDYPVDQIADVVLAGDEAAMAAIDLSAGALWLAVHRGPEGVEARRLAESDWALTNELCAGHTLADAFGSSPVPDLPALLADHLVRGRFSRFLLPAHQEQDC